MFKDPETEAIAALGMPACLAGFTACEDTPEADVAAADLTRRGFVRDEALARRLDGHTIRVGAVC